MGSCSILPPSPEIRLSPAFPLFFPIFLFFSVPRLSSLSLFLHLQRVNISHRTPWPSEGTTSVPRPASVPASPTPLAAIHQAQHLASSSVSCAAAAQQGRPLFMRLTVSW